MYRICLSRALSRKLRRTIEFEIPPITPRQSPAELFTTDSVVVMFSELRKYGLSITLATLYSGQIKSDVLDSILGNVGTVIAFRVGPMEAPGLSRHFDGVEPRDLSAMTNFRMMVDEALRTEFFPMLESLYAQEFAIQNGAGKHSSRPFSGEFRMLGNGPYPQRGNHHLSYAR